MRIKVWLRCEYVNKNEDEVFRVKKIEGLWVLSIEEFLEWIFKFWLCYKEIFEEDCK